ncbi:TPA: hypothetical protein HA239_01570 [Candidatus Woesearchaeota archaeon]|nr:hypothetical protein QT06_C0001G0914 [archaeon GW2011_AR15]MBS3104603.1 hypothetical protein [Candidatus Woesearchaeota archaeon]HIH41082.1 hypothetical protein [Candidatus Woesearchaeota archaeon]
MKQKIFIVVILLLSIIVAACTSSNANKPEMIIYKSPTCGCCTGWAGYIADDYNIKIIENADINSIKAENGIPGNMYSCHTAFVEGYFVEGHVPAEAVEKLLAERPDIDGIALPGMPSGSPGMPGPKNTIWTIYAIKDGQASVFMTI